MKRKMYSVLDARAGIYGAPWMSINDETAIRDFARAVADPNSDIYHAPGDYHLVLLGVFDDESGAVSAHIPEPVVSGIQLAKSEE